LRGVAAKFTLPIDEAISSFSFTPCRIPEHTPDTAGRLKDLGTR